MDSAFGVILFGGIVLVAIVLNMVNKRNKPKKHSLKAEKKIDDAIDSKDIPTLIDYLRYPDTEIPFETKIVHRKKIIDGFRAIGLPAVESLIAVLQDTNSLERKEAVSILGEIGDRRATEPLLQIVKDVKTSDQNGLRKMAMAALGELGDAKAIPSLIEVADNDSNANVKVIAGSILLKLGDPRAFDILMKLLQIGSEELIWSSRTHGLSALGKTRDSKAIPLLVDHLSLSKLGDGEFKDEVRMAAANALAAIGEPALESLLAVINNPESESRHYACYALGWMGDTRALPALERLAQEKKIPGRMRGAANWAIDTIKKKQQGA